ncbi:MULTISPECIES: PilN domain-containing protein [Pantoea]|jgi:pilus assembly protein HofN|uniref:PilN domain-containing protein n=1 Tax=Pantoea eucrina TaxID=472693 RepID=A0ABS1Z9K4_9GAMM|nr:MULTISPECIES: PilN domain-containing protein [Pantoea]AIX49581.1 hypothetical protein PSNIH1_04650 [Pantoea sp. PSNIH1]KAA6042567.1 PilN domain-containing protein [Pantoea sp. Bo_7]KAA6087640.1 PilN domain-containing protein [Pantoea sp. Bo_10]MBM0749077.1 PilN domain-containing protein [Pantoea eucrina]MCL9648176.1 PilN domain-containing protein [Pantoea eucrina]
MLRVNLLPWRERQWQKCCRQTKYLLITALTLPLLVALVLGGYSRQQLTQAESATEQARQRLLALRHLRTQQQSLLQARDRLLDLQQQRQQVALQYQHWQRFWQQLPGLLPDALWLERIDRQQQLLRVEGWSDSVAAVSELRHRLLAQPLFAAVRQRAITRQSDGRYRFTLQARMREPRNE